MNDAVRRLLGAETFLRVEDLQLFIYDLSS